jgi:hypothetical protein
VGAALVAKPHRCTSPAMHGRYGGGLRDQGRSHEASLAGPSPGPFDRREKVRREAGFPVLRCGRDQSSLVIVPVPVNTSSVAPALMLLSVARNVSFASTAVSPLIVTVKVFDNWPAGIVSPTSDRAT